MITSATRFTDKSGFLSVYFNGTNWIGIEPSDLTAGSLPAGVTSDPLALISQVRGTNLAMGEKSVGLAMGYSSGNPASANGWTGAADQPSTFGTLRTHDTGVFWQDIETSQGVYNAAAVARLDAMVNAASAAGKDVLYSIGYVPAWASGGSIQAPPTNNAFLSNFVAWLLARYGVKITYIEGWNEPNVSGSFTGTLAQLVAHQKAIWTAVQTYNTANSTAIKVLSPQWTFQSGIAATLGLNAYMAAAYADSGSTGYYCNVIAYHFYSETNSLRFDRACVNAVVTAFGAFTGASALELWCTEVGDSYPNARAVKEMIAFCLANNVKRVILYDWYLPGGSGSDMRLSRVLTPAQFDAITAIFQGKTMNCLNSYRSQSINNGGSPQTQGAPLGATINNVPVLLT